MTNRITEVVKDEQFVNAFASSDLDLADFADVELNLTETKALLAIHFLPHDYRHQYFWPKMVDRN